jgi:acetamidase/formamidase/AraC-like DNA-binding protein
MSVRQFTSESYSQKARHEAWQDILIEFGLRSTRPAELSGHASAALRASSDGVVVGRLAASPQVLSAIPRRSALPLLLVPLENDGQLTLGAVSRPVLAGELALLPRTSDWRMAFREDVRAVALSVTPDAFGGRKVGSFDLAEARILPAEGLAAVLSGTLAATANALDVFSTAEWVAVVRSLSELLLALLGQPAVSAFDAGGTATQAALLHRIYQTIERRLDDPELAPARVASSEGISERYLQKLFEGVGDTFTHYVRERRLDRCRLDLSNPAEAHQSISQIAYRYGFGDAASFSRTFKDRFGLSPREFRQREAERLTALAEPHGQRGWPQEALAQLRTQRVDAKVELTGEAAVHGGDDSVRSDAEPRHHRLDVDAAHVHWGFFSRSLRPLIEIASGDTIVVETLSQHASDDPERMIHGDTGAESVFGWTRQAKNVDRRGAGPMDASIYGRGAGEGFGVHICTGPIAVLDAQPGDVLEVHIVDIAPRASRNPHFAGRAFGSSAASWWGYHYNELLSEPKPREVVTIYEIVASGEEPHARALYSYRWKPQTDPFGIVHKTYDYPGVLVAPETVERRRGVLDGIRIPLRPHFGVIGVAPKEAELVDSIPPSYFGGNLDNWRLGKGARVYLPVSVPRALLSIGDPHAAQGDGELGGTAIECSMTGALRVVLHKKADLVGRPFEDLNYPLIETETEWVLTGFSHPNYLAEFGAKGQSEVYSKSSLDLAMKDAFRKVRRFLMNIRGLSEDEAIALMSAAVDFGVTQVVDGNWGVHAILKKRLFASRS